MKLRYLSYDDVASVGLGMAEIVAVVGDDDDGDRLLTLLADPNLCDRSYLYEHYDQEVRGAAYLRPGEADAGLIAPFRDRPLGLAITADGNPFYGERDPWKGAALAVCESVRNLACVGAWPLALTDCLNYGNPEKPEAFAAFAEGVRAIGEACRKIGRMAEDEQGERPVHPIPVISGNVSFYNESAQGAAIPPSPVVGMVGRVPDLSKIGGMILTCAGNSLYMLGERREEMGASVSMVVVSSSFGDCWREFMKKAKMLSDRGFKVFLNPKPFPYSFIKNIFSKCKVFVYPARLKMFGVPVLEAMSQGLIPVVTTTTGARDFVKKVDPSLVTHLNVHTISKKIADLLSLDTDTLYNLSEKAKRVALSWNRRRAKRLFLKYINSLLTRNA